MALSGMEIQEGYPLLPELGLAQCITDSAYMRLIDTRAATVLAHNPGCSTCEHALQCLGGCRASALETTPDDILGRDVACCTLFRGGWIPKIDEVMKKIKPEAKRFGTSECQGGN